MFLEAKNGLIFKKGNETVLIEPWGKNAFRVRATLEADFTDRVWALTEEINHGNAFVTIKDNEASIKNGKTKIRLNNNGVMSFYKEDKMILKEYYRMYDSDASKESCAIKVINRQYQGIIGGDYKVDVRFNSNDGEKIFGLGQYTFPYLDMKGCSLELAQRNSQISVPFALSNLGYGFLWNNPAVGHVNFAKNITEWEALSTKEIDYWITTGDTPAEIVENYTEVSGRAPVLTQDYLGFWQCKLRYRTQEEVLTVARRYKEMGIHLDVIVIDFFHWPRQGDWCFDKEYWPDPKAMCDELHAMGTKVMVSVWPNVDKKCSHFYEMQEKGYLVRTERGSNQTYDWQGDCITFDATNPEARKYLWEICKKNYSDYGIDMFWLDNSEPDYNVYDFQNYRFQIGNGLAVSNIYPQMYSRAFYDGQKAMGQKSIVNLERCCWAGSQKYNQVIWNGDVQSTWECLQDSVAQGLNMGIAGIPWWTTDIGGFMYGDVRTEEFKELLERWFEWAVFTPILRLHGDRDPHDIPLLDKQPERGFGGGYLFTGQPNEIWSYGEKAQKIMENQIKLREKLKPYTAELMKEASENGSPVMRTMFYEFPEDEKCWDIYDQYMFGSEYLVAPVLHAGVTSRKVYLPEGKWENINTKEVLDGPCTIDAAAPIEYIPVFHKK